MSLTTALTGPPQHSVLVFVVALVAVHVVLVIDLVLIIVLAVVLSVVLAAVLAVVLVPILLAVAGVVIVLFLAAILLSSSVTPLVRVLEMLVRRRLWLLWRPRAARPPNRRPRIHCCANR